MNQQESRANWPPPAQAWYAVSIFGLALTINFLDRGILALLIVPIKEDLVLTDTQVSLVVGFAFVVFYMVLGLPIARLVDRHSRRLIVGLSIVFWSGMTAMCGLAQNFWQLFLFRVGVGVGEAGNGPATYSMMSDLFPPEKLPKAISVLNFGFVAGNGLALIIGGLVIKAISGLPELTVPIIGVLRPWQLTLIAVGLPGLLVAALMATVKEPVRMGLVNRNAEGKVVSIPVRKVVAFLHQNRATYLPMTTGMAAKAVMTLGTAIWLPTLFQRKFEWTLADIGVTQGMMLFAIAPLGLMAGGHVAERLARRGRDGANVIVVIVSGVLGIPFAIAYPLMPTAESTLILYGISQFFLFMAPGPQNAAIQIITPNQMRGQVTALWLFVFNVIGFGLGPTFIAMITDFVFEDESRLGEAMSVTAAVLGTFAMLVLWRGLKSYIDSVRRSKQWAQSNPVAQKASEEPS